MGVAGLFDLKKRIKSIENTKKLTKAMALVATSKLKKVRAVLYKNQYYFNTYKEVMEEIIPSLPKENIYMQRKNSSNKKLLIVITSDMGMCGAYNYSIVSKVQELVSQEKDNYKLMVIGERGKALLRRYKFDVVDFNGKISDFPKSEEAGAIAKYAFEMYREGSVDEVTLLYTWFKNPINKELIEKTVLPLEFNEADKEKINEDEFDIEGNKEELLEDLLPTYCNAIFYNAMINAKSSEQSFRMETMNSATKNASDLIANLKLKYNRIRQSAITQEIAEIVGGSEAQG